MAHRSALALLPLVLLALGAPARADDVSVTLPAGDGFAVKDNTGAVERLRVDEATGNVSRNGALFVHTSGPSSLFVGPGAGTAGSSGSDNTALGTAALLYNTTGGGNSAFGRSALSSNTQGSLNSAFGAAALSSNTTGIANSGFGEDALKSNTTGIANSGFGEDALKSNTTGTFNSALGGQALHSNTIGVRNAAFGEDALYSNIDGLYNSAFGEDSLRANTSGSRNSAFGRRSLRFNTGSDNIAVGFQAGQNATTGSNNIYIGNQGVAGESGKIRIGETHTETFIDGISGNVASGGLTVLINTSNELHTTVSSARFKQDVRDMEDASALLERLRPVVFRYREDPEERQYGLIAEEVAEVAPELVALDEEGQPYSVRYHVLPSLLLNELQRQQRLNAEQSERIAALEARACEDAE